MLRKCTTCRAAEARGARPHVLTPARARWVATEEWHPKQRASFEPDGSYVLEIPYGGDRELLGDILRHGAEVEVLAPRELRACCRDQLKAGQRLYAPR